MIRILKNLIKGLLLKKKATFLIFLFIVGGSVLFSLSLDNLYRSNSTLLPPESNDGSSNSLRGLTGLANISGVNIGNAIGNESQNVKTKLIRTLSSEDFLVPFAQNNNLLPFIFAFSKRIDQQIIYDENIWDGEKIIDESLLFDGKISRHKIYEKMLSILNVNESFEDGVITLSIETKDPYYSQKINELLLTEVDEYLRSKIKANAQLRINFLNDNIEMFSNNAERDNFVNLLVAEKIDLMNAEVSNNYTFQIIDMPNLPEKKSAPRRTLIVLFAFFLSCLISFLNIVSHKP